MQGDRPCLCFTACCFAVQTKSAIEKIKEYKKAIEGLQATLAKDGQVLEYTSSNEGPGGRATSALKLRAEWTCAMVMLYSSTASLDGTVVVSLKLKSHDEAD